MVDERPREIDRTKFDQYFFLLLIVHSFGWKIGIYSKTWNIMIQIELKCRPLNKKKYSKIADRVAVTLYFFSCLHSWMLLVFIYFFSVSVESERKSLLNCKLFTLRVICCSC